MKSRSIENSAITAEPFDKFDMSTINSAPPQPKLWKQMLFLYLLTSFGIIFPILLVVRLLSGSPDFTIAVGKAIIVVGVPVCLVITLIKLWCSIGMIKRQLGVKVLDQKATTDPLELWLIEFISQAVICSQCKSFKVLSGEVLLLETL